MSDLPYTKDVLRLAAMAFGAGRLPPPCTSHTEANPICGDRITVDLSLSGDVIAALAHDTRACVLTQASASILGQHLAGHAMADLTALHAAVRAMLNGANPPPGDFAAYGVLADVARHPARHRCVLLPIEAALKAGKPTGERA